MRSHHQIEKIRSRFENTKLIENFLDHNEIAHLIDLYENSDKEKIKKNTGPITLNINDQLKDKVLSKIFDNLKTFIGQYEVTAAFFFKTDYPHVIHNDDTYELPDEVYKGITIPLKLYGENILDFPRLCFFNQCYFHGPAKFFKNEKFVETYYNQQIYDYIDVDGITSEEFDKEIYYKYFTHLKYEWLQGLTLQSTVKWNPGSAIIFDSIRLHCASDFRKLGIKSKLGISIFTKK